MSEYCTVAEIGTLGINPELFADVSAADREKRIKSNSDLMDSYLGNRFTLPLVIWGDVLRECCAALTACALVDTGGRDPDADAIIDKIRDRWLAWLKMVSQGTVTPPGVVDSTPGSTPGSVGGARVTSATSRGYSTRGTSDERGPFQTD